MGMWTIVIHGTGCHHNKDNTGDANRMADEFVKQLTAAGHYISGAEFTFGSREDITVAPYVTPDVKS